MRFSLDTVLARWKNVPVSGPTRCATTRSALTRNQPARRPICGS